LILEGQVDRGFWWTFYGYLLEESKVSDDNLRGTLVKNTQKLGQLGPDPAWHSRVARSHRSGLLHLRDFQFGRQNRRSTGRSKIADCFQSVTDSGLIGYEKPHPAIFEAALRTIEARPEESLYVGDVYSVDYLGARNIGCKQFYLMSPEPTATGALRAWSRSKRWSYG